MPVFGSNGNFIQDTESDLPNYIFYDQRVRNIELDIVQDPIGAGHGFEAWSKMVFGWIMKFLMAVIGLLIIFDSFLWVEGELVSMHGVPVDGVWCEVQITR